MLQQGNHTFDDLLSEFNHLLLEAGAHVWDDKAKKEYLKCVINNSLKEQLIVIEKKDFYEAYCLQVKAIAD